MRLLFIVPYVPNQIRVRSYQLIRTLLARGHQISLATLWERDEERSGLESLREMGVEILASRLPLWQAAWNTLRALPQGLPMQAAYCWSSDLASKIESLVRAREFDIVHVEHLRGVHYGLHLVHVLGSRKNPKIVWDSVDCISHLFEEAAKRSGSLKGRVISRLDLKRTRSFEAWLLRQFDHVLVTSESEQKAFLELGGCNNYVEPAAGPATEYPPISVLTNGVDLDYFRPNSGVRDNATVVFSGKMSYHANETAALYLMRDVLPLVWQKRSDLEVCIVGKDPSQRLRAFDTASRSNKRRVRVTGTVEDVRPFLRRATLSVAPLRYGAGIQNKVLEAMACATPVLATPQAIDALSVKPGRDLISTSGRKNLAKWIFDLLKDAPKRARMSSAGRDYVEKHHSWNQVAARLEEIYLATLSQPASKARAS